MATTTTEIPRKFHQAVEKWRDTFLPDYDYLMENWDRYFPRDERFQLCAYRECGMPCQIECGEDTGKPKYTRACDMKPEAAHHLVGAIRAQASTEFGSIQQHQLTLARAQDEEEQAMVLRMMAEELRHGYQMLHLLTDDDWQPITGQTSEQTVEEILSMKTGSHVLGAFNIDFESFVDNIVFCALIDRVGKYQLAMQKVSAYSPMAESMPQMLREEAFHLATGVVPLRRWVVKAAAGFADDHHGGDPEAPQQVDAAGLRDVRRRARRRDQRQVGPEADEERRGPGPVRQGDRQGRPRPEHALPARAPAGAHR